MEYFNYNGQQVLCVSGSEIIISKKNPEGIVSASLVKKWQREDNDPQNPLVIQRACYNRSLLLNFSKIPAKYRDEISTKLGVPVDQAKVKPFKDKIIADPIALTYFSNYSLSDGRLLPTEKQMEYATNASVLNAVKEVYQSMKSARGKVGTGMNGFWARAVMAANDVRAEKNHSLPSKEVPFKRVYGKYIEIGYESLISRKYCNNNSRKVSDKIEHLIMSLYTMPNKPFASHTHILYLQFIQGQLELVDQKTGELFDPKDFYLNGKPIEVSETTVRNYLTQPKNAAIVDRARMGAHRYNNTHRPHHHRHAPNFSFSKLSMDDRDLPRKCINGQWVKAYYAYDVASGCVVGYAYSLNKNEALFLDCMKNMFRLIDKQGFGMPMEVEVENHLVNKFFDDLDAMFPFVHVCTPGNSQEKRAEHMNRAKKFGIEKKQQNGIGRWWAKHKAYAVDRDLVNNEFVEKNQLPYERLVADDIKACNDYNNDPHPNQKKYPKKTRWQVLIENMNPNMARPRKSIIYKAIGNKTETSIRRNHYATVMGAKYAISGFDVLDKLIPNNYNVEAYYLPDEEGIIHEVYLYQGDNFLCKADKIHTYNESKAEATAIDWENYKRQGKVVSEFDAATKKAKKELASPVVYKSEILKEALAEEVEIVPQTKEEAPVQIDELIENNNYDDEDAGDSL
ncbi:MAG: hypothetical protein JNK73_13010 [Bacteroidia bacterium]|nr:hypothetical protein [Bacteroidia bacterium]